MRKNAMSRTKRSIALILAFATGGSASAFAAERNPDTPKIACDGLGTCVAGFSIDIGTSEALFTVQAGTTEGSIVASTRSGAVGALPVSDAFRPESLRLGIVAILIGVAVDPSAAPAFIDGSLIYGSDERPGGARQLVPVLAFQDGDEIFAYAFVGRAFRLLERSIVPFGASASAADLIELLLSRYTFGPIPDGS
jgi:hypothetical protein